MIDSDDIILRRRRAELMLVACLPEQRAAIEDPSHLKAFFATRRAGKSFAIGIYLFMTAIAYPGSSCLYLGLTRETAQNIMNKDIFRVLNRRFVIGAKWKVSDKRWELPNGSYIYMRGADANSYEINKTVGQKYRLAVLDEASKYRYNVRTMVYGSLLPAMGDDLGTVVLSGTPSNITTGLFYDATTGAEAARGWARHMWSWRDNVHKRTNIAVIHDKIVADNPDIVHTPLYRQEWLGQWVVDSSALVYRFREDRNTIDKLPLAPERYTWMLGGDLGYAPDPSALVVGAYNEHDPCLYLVHAEKRAKQDFTDVANWVKSLWKFPALGHHGPYPFTAMVMDAANLQGVEEMRGRHGLPLEGAKKQGKAGVIAAMNGEIITGRVKVLPGAMGILEEARALVWDEKKLAGVPKRWEEDPRFAQHELDSALYLWRRARNYDAAEAPAPPLDKNSNEWASAEFDRLLESRKVLQQTAARSGGVMVDHAPGYIRERFGWVRSSG